MFNTPPHLIPPPRLYQRLGTAYTHPTPTLYQRLGGGGSLQIIANSSPPVCRPFSVNIMIAGRLKACITLVPSMKWDEVGTRTISTSIYLLPARVLGLQCRHRRTAMTHICRTFKASVVNHGLRERISHSVTVHSGTSYEDLCLYGIAQIYA